MLKAKQRKQPGKFSSGVAATILLLAITGGAIYAGQPVVWETSGRAGVLAGRLPAGQRRRSIRTTSTMITITTTVPMPIYTGFLSDSPPRRRRCLNLAGAGSATS